MLISFRNPIWKSGSNTCVDNMALRMEKVETFQDAREESLDEPRFQEVSAIHLPTKHPEWLAKRFEGNADMIAPRNGALDFEGVHNLAD